ncbi:MAG TPA: methyltransferase domain-containing protein [Pelomicrobium sp.]|nr:methyltransferase domain-containing protein [Pelomicrobium sp.]
MTKRARELFVGAIAEAQARGFVALVSSERLRQVGAHRMAAEVDAESAGRARARVARPHLRGEGLEIGALHFPLRVPRRARVRYVDRMSKADALRAFPDLDPDRVVSPEFIDDGFTLADVPDASQDFLIANHVLEHAPDVLGTLETWSRVLRPGGHLILSVPVAARCFDRERPLTPVAHFEEDYRLRQAGREDEFWQATRAHYDEWTRTSHVNILREQGREVPERSEAEIERETDARLAQRVEIHFHTFSAQSFGAMLARFCEAIRPGMTVARVADLTTEVMGIVRRGA